MDIWYKRTNPNGDPDLPRHVLFSSSKRKFNDNVFLSLNPQTPDSERKHLVEQELQKIGVGFKKINLIKL